MGVVNVTPDSFSDGGRFLDPDAAVAHGRAWSPRAPTSSTWAGSPAAGRRAGRLGRGAAPGGAGDRGPGRRRCGCRSTPVKPAVARAAVAAGATLVNDVSASLAEVAAELDAGYVVMHRQGTPKTMQLAPHYDDVVAEVARVPGRAGRPGRSAGHRRGVGRSGHRLRQDRRRTTSPCCATSTSWWRLGRPVLVGTSRKGFLGRLVARSDARPHARTECRPNRRSADPESSPVGERLEASLATATWAMAQGARMVRVHDVGPTVQAAKVVAA